jgi:hypothetical protein
MNNCDRISGQPLQIGPITRLLHRFAGLEDERKVEVVKDLSLQEGPLTATTFQFRRYLETLRPSDDSDRTQLASLWARVDAAHPNGPAKEGNQFLKRKL